MLEIMMEELKTATKDFYHMTGIKIVLYDEQRRHLHTYPDGMCDFCCTVRKNSALAEKCLNCDRLGFDTCDKTRKPYIYRCHMGLSEAIMPICEGNEIIGYMMMGQILGAGDRDLVEQAIEAASAENTPERGEFYKGLAGLRSVDDAFVRSALNVMSMCVCYLNSNSIIRRRSEDFPSRLRSYVEKHYTEPLSVSELCHRLYISKSKLYQISLEAFGMGVSDYIRACRMEKAKRMLEETEKPVAQIAAEVGFQDANFFTRSFKKETGMTPKDHRKSKKAP
ncbi:MAG: PocR ligand-binding domain-containing protein [Clostridia bacterium]|nr:PocR ligand-binding domain-containing protein [Clostridia bacterium]